MTELGQDEILLICSENGKSVGLQITGLNACRKMHIGAVETASKLLNLNYLWFSVALKSTL